MMWVNMDLLFPVHMATIVLPGIVLQRLFGGLSPGAMHQHPEIFQAFLEEVVLPYAFAGRYAGAQVYRFFAEPQYDRWSATVIHNECPAVEPMAIIPTVTVEMTEEECATIQTKMAVFLTAIESAGRTGAASLKGCSYAECA